MSLVKYLQIINKINPQKIEIENVRSILNVNTSSAKTICETLVRENIFIKKIGIICPNTDCGRIIEEFDSYEEIPEEITCEICEDNEEERYTFKTQELEKIVFYKLKK